MATTPSFTGTPRLDGNVTSGAGATTPFTAPSDAVLVFTAGASGSLITRIDVIGLEETGAAETVFLYWYNGSNYRLWNAVDVDAITTTAGTPPFRTSLVFPEGVPVPGSGFNRLYAATFSTMTVGVMAYGGDF